MISALESVKGDIFEFELGVARGRSLITTGLILESLNSSKKVVGLDWFQGFPCYSPEDDFENFEVLFNAGSISQHHFNRVSRNAAHVKACGDGVHPSQISNSLDFSNTSKKYVQSRIDYLGLSERVSIRSEDFSVELEELIEG